jgi:hypothetical protein
LPSAPTKSRRVEPPARIALRSVRLIDATSRRAFSGESRCAFIRGSTPAPNRLSEA